MTRWLLEEVIGSGPQSYHGDWEDGLLMLRYDEAVFSSASHSCNSGLAEPTLYAITDMSKPGFVFDLDDSLYLKRD
jgi:hypothetical protein